MVATDDPMGEVARKIGYWDDPDKQDRRLALKADLRAFFRAWRRKLDAPAKLGNGWVRGKYGCWYEGE